MHTAAVLLCTPFLDAWQDRTRLSGYTPVHGYINATCKHKYQYRYYFASHHSPHFHGLFFIYFICLRAWPLPGCCFFSGCCLVRATVVPPLVLFSCAPRYRPGMIRHDIISISSVKMVRIICTQIIAKIENWKIWHFNSCMTRIRTSGATASATAPLALVRRHHT